MTILRFELDEKETKKYDNWLKKHNTTCKFYDDGSQQFPPGGAIGGRFSFCFTPTSIGVAVTAKCACGEEINLTNYENW